MEQFFTNVHLSMLNSWLEKRGMDLISEEDVPSMGFIVPGIAAGFLRQCEGNVAIIDSLVTNPDACPVVRHYQLNKIYDWLIAEAESQGIKKLIGFTRDEHTLRRSLDHGFVISPYTFLVRFKEL